MFTIQEGTAHELREALWLARRAAHVTVPAELVLRALEQDRGLFLVARGPDGPSGALVGMGSGPLEARILLMAVAPEAQRLGIGGQLLRSAITAWQRQGVRSLGLEVRADNSDGLRFYQRHGFEIEGFLEGVYEDGADGWAMRKVLS